MSNKLLPCQWPWIFWEIPGCQPKTTKCPTVCLQAVYDWVAELLKWALKSHKQTKKHWMWSNLINLNGHLISLEKDHMLRVVVSLKDAWEIIVTTNKYLWHRKHNNPKKISNWFNSVAGMIFSNLPRITTQKTKNCRLNNVARINNRWLTIETTKKCSKFRTLCRGVPKIQPPNCIPRKDDLVQPKNSPCSLQGKIHKAQAPCVRIVKSNKLRLISYVYPLKLPNFPRYRK